MQEKTEKLSGDLFAEGMERLENAFNYSIPEGQMSVYVEKILPKFDAEQFKETIELLIENCFRFPTIADFMKHKDSVKSVVFKAKLPEWMTHE